MYMHFTDSVQGRLNFFCDGAPDHRSMDDTDAYRISNLKSKALKKSELTREFHLLGG